MASKEGWAQIDREQVSWEKDEKYFEKKSPKYCEIIKREANAAEVTPCQAQRTLSGLAGGNCFHASEMFIDCSAIANVSCACEEPKPSV